MDTSHFIWMVNYSSWGTNHSIIDIENITTPWQINNYHSFPLGDIFTINSQECNNLMYASYMIGIIQTREAPLRCLASCKQGSCTLAVSDIMHLHHTSVWLNTDQGPASCKYQASCKHRTGMIEVSAVDIPN